MLWSSFSFARLKDDISRALRRLPLLAASSFGPGGLAGFWPLPEGPAPMCAFRHHFVDGRLVAVRPALATARRTQAGVAITRFGVDFSGVPRDGLKEELSGLAR